MKSKGFVLKQITLEAAYDSSVSVNSANKCDFKFAAMHTIFHKTLQMYLLRIHSTLYVWLENSISAVKIVACCLYLNQLEKKRFYRCNCTLAKLLKRQLMSLVLEVLTWAQ